MIGFIKRTFFGHNSLLYSAKAKERDLVFDARFWVGQFPFFIVVAIGIFVIIAFFKTTYPDRNEYWLMVFVIHMLGAAGFLIAFYTLAVMHIEHAIAEYTDKSSSGLLRQIKSGNRDRLRLDRLDDLLVYNPGRKMTRLFQHILTEARDRRFDSSVLIMQPYRDESYEDIIRLHTIQRIALQLGILGTFVGFFLALPTLTRQADGTQGNLFQENLTELLDSLNVVFSTSIAGLEVAIILGLMLMWMRYKQNNFFKTMESATVAMISLARNSINPDDLLAGLADASEAMQQLEVRVEDQRAEIRTLTSEIKRGIAKLGQTQGEFEGFLNKVGETQGEFLGEMKMMYEKLSPVTISRELKNSLEATLDRIGQSFDAKLNDSMKTLMELPSVVSEVEGVLKQLEGQLKQQAAAIEAGNVQWEETKGEFEKTVGGILGAHKTLLDALNSVNNITMEEMSESLESSIQDASTKIVDHFAEDFKEIGEMMDNLGGQLSKSNRLMGKLVRRSPADLKKYSAGRIFWRKLKKWLAEMRAKIEDRTKEREQV